MILKKISNVELLNELKALVFNERRQLTEILFHLKEVDRRRLHLSEGYASLFDYAVKALGYSEAQAYRRISGMQLLKEVPELEQTLKEGRLNLTHLSQAREYFKMEQKKKRPLSVEEKVEILKALENKTTRETQMIFAKLSPNAIPADRERVIREGLVEIRFVASEGLLAKLKRFQDLDSHVQKNPNYAELFERLVDLALRNKMGKSESEAKTEWRNQLRVSTTPRSAKSSKVSGKKVSAPKNVGDVHLKELRVPQITRHISEAVKHKVLNRDQRFCTYQNPKTGKICGSTFRLQLDHRVPFGKGGSHQLENLRLLCQNHNLFMAEQAYGKRKMAGHTHRAEGNL